MTEPTFHELIDKLTRGQAEFVKTDDGQKLVTSDGLLERLREAVFGGASGGGGAQGKAKLPLDAAALDILEEIDTQAAEALAHTDSRPTPFGTAESYVRLWSAAVTDETPVTVTVRETIADRIESVGPRVFNAKIETTAIALVRAWVRRIEEFFEPPMNSPIPAACPREECGQRYSFRQSDGAEVRGSALSIQIDRETRRPLGASCSACGHRWEVNEIPRLAVLCGFEPDPNAVALFLHDTPTELVVAQTG